MTIPSNPDLAELGTAHLLFDFMKLGLWKHSWVKKISQTKVPNLFPDGGLPLCPPPTYVLDGNIVTLYLKKNMLPILGG